jgi:hypothetical protein
MPKVLALMPCLSFLTRGEANETLIKKSLWLNGLNTYQALEFLGYNLRSRGDEFSLIQLKKKKVYNSRRKQTRKRKSKRERNHYISLSPPSLFSLSLSLPPLSLSPLSLPLSLSFG